jgi:ferric-dicitrate binding protein FerR (iron transport regulator)
MAWDRASHRSFRLSAMRLFLLAFVVYLSLHENATAQGIGCVVQTAASQRQILRCRDGLTIEAEAGAAFNLVDQNRDAQPDAINLQSRAIFIDAPARSAGQGFQIMTPQAIAAVRGTQWAVDVSGSRTSVFVVNGRVSVRRVQGNTRSVSLSPGEGVDVESGTSPLIVRRWPEARAAALLARLGR